MQGMTITMFNPIYYIPKPHKLKTEERMDFSYRFFNMDNTYVSAETSCFLPNSILFVNKMDCRLRDLVERYKDKMPENVREQCEKLCKELKNSYGKVE